MDNTSSTSRENKKKQLRRQIVSSNFSSAPSGRGDYEEEEDSREIVYNAHRKVIRRRVRLGCILLALAAIAALCLFRYNVYHEYTDYSVLWEKDFSADNAEGVGKGEGNFNGYVDFADGMLKYTKDCLLYTSPSPRD